MTFVKAKRSKKKKKKKFYLKIMKHNSLSWPAAIGMILKLRGTTTHP